MDEDWKGSQTCEPVPAKKAEAPEPARLENALDFQTGRFSGLPILCYHTNPQSIDIHLALVINKAGTSCALALLPTKL